MTKKTDFFLGANSPSGFYSLYHQLGDAGETKDFIILKGGPGVGKSTFMKYIAQRAQQSDFSVELIHCSGDPASLDGVIIPDGGIVVADGTAPHVIEPNYPAAVDRYVNLGCFYDVDRLKEHRHEIMACTKGYKECYDHAYACLHARRAVLAELEYSLLPHLDDERLARRMNNIWLRERKKHHGVRGKQRLRFLEALTPSGYLRCEETLYTLCKRIYEVQDTYHLSAPILARLRDIIRDDGYDVTVCLDPHCPARVSHLIVPEAGIAFVTTEQKDSLSKKPWRCIYVDRFIDADAYRRLRGSIRLKQRLVAALEEEGAAHLHMAGEKHDELEAIYHPFVDFDGVLAAAEAEARRFFPPA